MESRADVAMNAAAERLCFFKGEWTAEKLPCCVVHGHIDDGVRM
jgi:hypothetical protein